MKEFTEEFKWHKLRRPNVTNCCSSFGYAETTGGTFCEKCNSVKPHNVRTATVDDFIHNGIFMTEEKMKEMYD